MGFKVGLGTLYVASLSIFFLLTYLVYHQMNFNGNFDCLVTNENVKVHGTSMEPMIKDGRELKFMRKYYECNEPQRNDIVLYNYAGSKDPLIKRVVGIPGDTFSYVDNKIIINGVEMTNSEGKPYVVESQRLTLYTTSYPTIPENAYLILGDNPTGSTDSSVFGLVSKNDILGKVVLE